MSIALALGGGAGRVAPADPAASSPAALSFSVAVLPFISVVRTAGSAPVDADGYRAAGKAAPQPASGPAEVLAGLITASGKAVGLPARKNPKAEAAIGLEGVFTAFGHRYVQTPQPHWEAEVELGIRVKDTFTGEEFLSDFYRGSAPAKGPLVQGIEQEIFQNGIGAYAATPLGQAFRQAVDRALQGYTVPAAEREADLIPGDVEPADASSAQKPGVLPLLQGMTGQARVVGPEEKGIRINAGQANGLAVGQELTLFRVSAQPQNSSPFDTLGKAKVKEAEKHSAWIQVVEGEAPAGAAIMPSEHAEESVFKTKAIIDLGSAPYPPESFVKTLKLLLDQFELDKSLGWGRNTLEAQFKVTTVVPKPYVWVTLIDRRSTQKVQIGTWKAYVTERDGTRQAREAFEELTRPINKGVVPDLSAGARRAPVAPAAQLVAHRGDLDRMLGNRRPAFRVGIGFQEPPTGILELADPLAFTVGASGKCYLVIYSYDAERQVRVAWPSEPPMELDRGRLAIDGAKVAAPLGPEYLIAVAWTSRDAALEMLRRKPESLDELGQVVREVATARSGSAKLASAEPKRSLDDLLFTASQEVASLPAGETPEYSTAWLKFRTGR